MKRLLLLIVFIAASEAIPQRRHPLDQVGPIAKRRSAVRQITEPIEKYEEKEPIDIPEINIDLGLMEGDLMRSADTRNTLADDYSPESFWTSTEIPVQYMSSIGPLARATIDEARKEYELRTCLSLPDRINETNYITFRSLGGCWSYIGMVGGAQNISIGSGCERIGTIEHEIMHALGIWHEQSRADRDEYVEIVWDKIREGTESNFNNYNYTETDNRRLRYDYYSIMHYSKSGFSTDGNITIRTRDPAFQDVIGQRGGFSERDATKIGRMYDCSDTVRITNNADFEDEAEGGYSQHDLNSDVEWLQHKIGISDTSGPTTRYLPTFDSTHGIEGEGSFMYLDTTMRFSGLSGVIKSMRYQSTVEHQCLEFSYYIKLESASDAAMTVYIATIDPVTGSITNYGKPLQTFDLSSNLSRTEWSVHRMTVSAPSVYKVVFYAKTSWYYSDVIAIDDVTVRDKECDTSYFMIENYSERASSYLVDQAITSPIMYTDGPMGYAYQILFYPNGSQAAVDIGYTEYTSAYFQLCPGIHDDHLQWPFDKQYLRLMVTDQAPNPTTRINHFVNFLSESDSPKNASWEKPSGGSCNPPDGYRGFMRKEQFNRRMYLKRDTVYFSVQVTDMRPYENAKEITAKLTNPTIRKRSSLAAPEPKKFDFHWHEKEEPTDPIDVPDYPNDDQHEQPSTNDSEEVDGMIPIATAAIIVLSTSFAIFFVMSIAICCVASSFRKKMKTNGVTNNLNFLQFETSGHAEVFQLERNDMK